MKVKVESAASVPDQEILYGLEKLGPPYLFASREPFGVGDTFELGGQPFSIVRMCEKQEYELRHLSPNAVYFFEAVTD